jgi:hypothetical protein
MGFVGVVRQVAAIGGVYQSVEGLGSCIKVSTEERSELLAYAKWISFITERNQDPSASGRVSKDLEFDCCLRA